VVSLDVCSLDNIMDGLNGYICKGDTTLYVLEKWVAMRTVSGNPKYTEECRRGARFLKNILQQLGAHSRMVMVYSC
jgi:hypothetical protein